MKNTSNIIKNRFLAQTQLFGVLLVIIAMFLIACGSSDTTDDKTTISGSLSYVDILTTEGNAATGTPILGGALTGQEVAYSIARVDSGPLDSGISIDGSTGEITVATTAVRSSSLDLYSVSVVGIGEYKGTIKANLNIWVQAFEYATLNITSSTSITQSPPQTPAGATFALKEVTSGLSINSTNGGITINPILLSAGTGTGVYIVVVTEGAEEYEVGIEIVFPKPINKAALISLVNSELTSNGATANLNYIDTSLVTDMSAVFQNNATFNGDISGWNVSNVTDMSNMFNGATVFNGDLSGWNVGNGVTKTDMFVGSGLAGNEPSWY